MLLGTVDGAEVTSGTKVPPGSIAVTTSKPKVGPATFPPVVPVTNDTAEETTTTDPPLSAYELRRQQLLEDQDSFSESDLQPLRETHINALHEAIDAKLVDQSFIRTLGSVSEPPKVNDAKRDTLTIRSIVEDLNFTIGDRVVRWKTISQKNLERHMVVGLRAASLVVLHETDEGVFLLNQELMLESPPIAFEVFTLWDTDRTTVVGCVVISMGNFLVWYTLRQETDYQLLEEWRWPLHKTITQIRFFRHKEVDALLLIGKHPNHQQSISATVYEFSFNARQFWLMQKIGLPHPCPSVGLVKAGDEFLVALPQEWTVQIYSFRIGDQQRRKFKLIGNYTSPDLRSVDAFQIGRYAYIAIGGRSPAVLRYQRGKFYAQKIPTESLEIVEAFFEIPARTFRDDMILLVQHRMIFDTHDVQRLEALVWNGVSFDLATNIPCMVENDVIDKEASCMLDLERTDGLFGAAIVQRGKLISIIVPRHEAHSSLYHLSIELLSGEHPILMKIQEIKETMDAFTRIIDHQNAMIEQAQSFVSLMESDPVVLRRQELKSIQTPHVRLAEGYNFSDTVIMIGQNNWRESDFRVDLSETVKTVQDIEASVDAMLAELEYSVKRDARSHDLQYNGTLKVQGKVYIDGKLEADDLYIQRIEPPPPTDHQLRFVRQTEGEQLPTPLKELHLQDLIVEQLYFESFNGVPAADIAYNVDGKVELSGDLVVTGDLYTNEIILPDGGTVNGIDLSERLVYFNCKNRSWRNLTLDSLEVVDDLRVAESINEAKVDLKQAEASLRSAMDEEVRVLRTKKLTVEGDLTFELINGIPWQEFLDGLIFKNTPMRLRKLHVHGNVTFGKHATIQFLNGIRFPEDYVLTEGPRETIITGQKHFQGPLSMDALDIDGFINGINPFDFITLHDDQYIPGNVTFESLEIEESLDLRGTVQGKHMDQFLDNPSLLQTKTLAASCEFSDIVVNGPIYIDQLDGYDLDTALEDVVYNDEPYVEINASKHYRNLRFLEPIRVESNMLGEIHLDELLTKSTDQTLNVSMIVGNVFFNRVQTDGLFAGINVTDWDTNSIKTFGEQYTEATLDFCPGYSELHVNELEILESLNDVRYDGYHSVDEEIVFKDQQVYLNALYSDSLKLTHSSIDGPSKLLNGVHLPTFDANRFSVSRPQRFEHDVFIDTLYVDQSLATHFFNGYDAREFQQSVETYLNDDYMLGGQHPINTLHVVGNVEVGMLNGIDFTRFLDDVIWLDRPNAVPGLLKLTNPLQVVGDLTVEGTLNDIPLNDFLSRVVYRTEGDGVVEFTGSKLFTRGFDVHGDLNTSTINNIPVKDFLLKNETITLPGNLITLGRVYAKEVIVTGAINGKSFKAVEEYYSYDNATDTHVIKGDLQLAGHQMIHHLEAFGGWNEVVNVSHRLASLIRTNQDYYFKGHYVFKNEVHFKYGYTVDVINGHNVSNIRNEIMYFDQTEPIVFTQPVHFLGKVAGDKIRVEGDLIGRNIQGIDPDEYARRTLLVNRDYEIFEKLVFQPGTFVCDALNASVINGVATSDLITLHTEQTIERPVHLKELILNSPLQVAGLVNGRDLRLERQNTVMRYGEQLIETPSVFNSIRVLEKLTLPPVLNGVPVHEPLQLSENMTISSPITFYEIAADEVYTEDTIGGIHFDQLYDESLWTDGREHQLFRGHIRTQKLVFRDAVHGNGTLNGHTIGEIAERLHAEKRQVEASVAKHRSRYRTACHETQSLINGTQQGTYFFNYFVQRQTINERRDIQSFWTFEQHGIHFLVINFGCESKLYQWNPHDRVFVGLFETLTGHVYEWRTVTPDEDTLYLVTRSAPVAATVAASDDKQSCTVGGLSIWKFKGLSLELVKSYGDKDADSLFVDGDGSSSLTDRFYALEHTTVREYGVAQGVVRDEWDLSRIFSTAAFLPSSLNIGLALADGKQLAILSRNESTTGTVRRKRSHDQDSDVTLSLFASPMNMLSHMGQNKTYYYRTEDPETPDNETVIDETPQLTQPDPLNKIGSDQEGTDPVIQTRETAAPDVLDTIIDRNTSTDLEQRIGKEVPLGRIRTMENTHLPDPTTGGEVLSFNVGLRGERRRVLVAVTETIDTIIQGKHDSVRIYSDILQGHVYQIIACSRPSQLAVLEIRDETILTFIEQGRKVQLYQYRPRKGFVHWNSFNLASAGVQMAAVRLPQAQFFKCPLHYLAIALTGQELMFLKAKTKGDCGINLQLDCGTD
ncbi:uncharacterized protein LOC126570125 [Anopheles aquasalis]|uniref:uncharacterized protein LOC126570125 n=1 Tax=Anopheles aquasalis TaxID=42839 RepID=UPI00215A5783|nr:uncharacterized protein LOC126570125 [Anopheles aquasalis]